MIHHHVDVLFGFDNVEQLDDVWVVQDLIVLILILSSESFFSVCTCVWRWPTSVKLLLPWVLRKIQSPIRVISLEELASRSSYIVTHLFFCLQVA